MTVLVTGARGNIGARVVARLAEAGVAVRAASRDTAALDVPNGVDTVALDLTDPAAASAALADVTTVFLYPTFGRIDGFCEVAAKAGVEHVVLLSSPAAYDVVEYEGFIGLAHRAVEAAVEASGLRHTVLYPSWLATNTVRDWSDGIRASGTVAIADPDWPVNPIHINDVAAVATDLLTRDKHRSRRQVITGPESLRLRDIVTELAAAIGRPLAVEELTHRQALARRPEDFPEAAFQALLDVGAHHVGVPALVNNNVERITGRPARPFREWAAGNRGAFAG